MFFGIISFINQNFELKYEIYRRYDRVFINGDINTMTINNLRSFFVGRRLAFFLLLSFLVCLLAACGGGGESGSSGSSASSADNDNDGIENDVDNCPMNANADQMDTDGDKVGDACDEDDDNDGLDDIDGREQQTNSDDMSCSLLEDCDGDSVEDIDEVAVNCVIETDCDRDSVMDGADIDDDGDGLIEIGTAAELNAVRYALNGNGRRSLRNGVLNIDGCGNGNNINSCAGYELVTDISLTAYANNERGKGWQPLGHDTDRVNDGCQGAVFNGTFEGNGFMISDLSINRSAEDCVGLFGYMAANSEIRNLTLRAESVVGRNIVGGLVGYTSTARIVSSSVVVAEVSGNNNVGGLVGDASAARILSSSVVAGEVRGKSGVGGLVGNGGLVQIHSSSVVAGVVSGSDNNIGGLVGAGDSARIHSSSVVVGEVIGITAVAGLIGRSARSAVRIVSSSVVVGEVSGTSFVGGLVGSFGFGSGQIAYSYVVSGSNTRMLVGIGGETGIASYWDSDTSSATSENLGTPQTTSNLRSPTGYEGIYAQWDDNPVRFDNGSMIDVPLAVWCDRDNSGSIEAGEGIDANLIWDFGTSSQYPAIKCTPISPTEWRDWWFLNATGKPELDQDRLEEALNQ